MENADAPVLVVTGLLAEARIASGPGVAIICRGNRQEPLRDRIPRGTNDRFRAVISFGVAGGLDPALAPGRIIIARQLIRGSKRLATDAALTRHLHWKLAISDALIGDIAAESAPLCTPEDKQALRLATGAHVVDMESWEAVQLAAEFGVGFAAIRAVCDPAHRRVPPAALAGLNADGSASSWSVVRNLLTTPRDLPDLAQCATGWVRALRALRRARWALGAGFGLSDL